MKFGTDIWVFAAVVLRECYYFIPAILQSLLPYANCSRAGGWVCDWALRVVSAWIKDCRRLLQTFFDFHLLIFFFYCPFSDRMKTWHFLQPSSKLWRTWRLDWIPGNTQLGTPSCIIQQVRHCFCVDWLQTVLTAFLYETEQLLQVVLCFFFSKVVFKKWGFFPFFPWPLTPKFDHVLFAFEKLIYYRSTCFQHPELFPGLSSLWALVIFIHYQIILLGLVNLFVAIGKNIFL